MNKLLKNALVLAGVAAAAHASAQVTFYENDAYAGRSFTTEQRVNNFGRFGFNDRASSVIVTKNLWEVCEDVRLAGHCVVLRPGQYASLAAMGLNDRVSSVRKIGSNERIDAARFAPLPVASYDGRRRPNERLFEANVVSVRAVVGPPEQRCWIEREQVVQERERANVPRALAGAVLGGILGHQIGGGTGRDLATVGGVVAGAAIGGRSGRDGAQVTTQNVQHCSTLPAKADPDYWDVTYSFRGQEHRVQMTTPPGATVTVNRNGEPRAS